MKRLAATTWWEDAPHNKTRSRAAVEATAMDHIGIDVHKNASQVCIRTETGQLIERRVRTDRESFAKWLGKRDKARILIESSTESEWVARCLEELGHEVIVADPNFAPMYA